MRADLRTFLKATGWGLAIVVAVAGCVTKGSVPPPTGAGKLELTPDDSRDPTAKTLYATARLMMAQRRDDQAERLLLKIIDGFPYFMPAYCDLAKLRIDQDRLPEADEAIRLGLAKVPADPVLLNNAGVCRLMEGDYEAALGRFAEAAQQAPSDPKYVANQALALALLGRYAESQTLYEHVLAPKAAAHNVAVVRAFRNDPETAPPPPAPAVSGSSVLPEPLPVEPEVTESVTAEPLPAESSPAPAPEAKPISAPDHTEAGALEGTSSAPAVDRPKDTPRRKHRKEPVSAAETQPREEGAAESVAPVEEQEQQTAGADEQAAATAPEGEAQAAEGEKPIPLHPMRASYLKYRRAAGTEGAAEQADDPGSESH